MHYFGYSFTVMFPLLSLWCLNEGGHWLFVMTFVAFGIIPMLDAIWTGNNMRSDRPHERQHDVVLYTVAFLHLLVVICSLVWVSLGRFDSVDIWFAMLTTGLSCGVFGINIGHELGHRSHRFHRFC